MTVTVNEAALQAVTHNIGGPLARRLMQLGPQVESIAKMYASGVGGGPNVQSGRLRSSITTSVGVDGDGLFLDVGSNVRYARWVELGTEPTVIFPRVKKALFWKGAEHPVAYVIRLGNRPKPYLRPAAQQGALLL